MLVICLGCFTLLGCADAVWPTKADYDWYDETYISHKLSSGEVVTDQEWREMLMERVFTFPDEVSADEDVTVSICIPNGLIDVEIRLVPRRPKLRTLVCGLPMMLCGTVTFLMRTDQADQLLGSLPQGHHQVVFDVAIEQWGQTAFSASAEEIGEPDIPDILWSGEVSTTIVAR